MSRRRKRPSTWLAEEIDRSRLDAMDADDAITTLSTGELPGWMRTRWARARMTGKHDWVDAAALPPLYTRAGLRLPVEASVATLRILTYTTASKEHDDVALVRDYLHPIACARLVEHLLVRWSIASAGALDFVGDATLLPDSKLVFYHFGGVDPVTQRTMDWAPQSHRIFNDRHSVERAVSLLTYGVFLSDDPELPRWRRRAFPRDGRSLVFTFRHAGDFGDAALRVLCYSNSIGEYAREASRQVNPHKHRYHYHDTSTTNPDVMSFEAQLDAVAALGFAEGERALTAEDGTRRWVGVDLFESLSDGDQDHPMDPDLPRESVMAAVAIFRHLFAQTEAQLELHRQGGQSWDAPTWRSIFLEHAYMTFWARRVIWSTQASDEGTFRVCDDTSLADAADDPFTLAEHASVRVASAQTISAPTLARWSELFADYEIINPTDQLDATDQAATSPR